MLKCENPKTNTIDIVNEFHEAGDNRDHENITADFDHGQWFVTCSDCGAQWSVNDARGRDGDYFQFDQVSVGDDYCYSK